MRTISGSISDLDWILSPSTIRLQCRKIYDQVLEGKGQFTLHLENINEAATQVVEVIKKNYPTLHIPYHSRVNHINAGQASGHSERFQKIMESAGLRSALELIVVSVLLDAGAGMAWKYQDPKTGEVFTKSEGLAQASLAWFLSGDFSSDPSSPLQVNPSALRNLKLERFQKFFQISPNNPLLGDQGRFQLLKKLGFALEKLDRVSDIFSEFFESPSVFAVRVLRVIQENLGPIWPSPYQLKIGDHHEIGLGDVAEHPLLKDPSFPENSIRNLIPFHKLSQWLTYSILHAFELAGKKVIGIEQLTGLPEYRNGGLFIDTGVLKLKDKSLAQIPTPPFAPLIVEWRALTVILLDEISIKIREILGRSESDFPLPCVLEGGTWSTGRILAQRYRPDGGSPIFIQSDGTVF